MDDEQQQLHHNLFITLLLESETETVSSTTCAISNQKCRDYIEKSPFMLIFPILSIHFWDHL